MERVLCAGGLPAGFDTNGTKIGLRALDACSKAVYGVSFFKKSMTKANITLIVVAVFVGIVVLFGAKFIKTVEPGHVAVATLFGEVVPEQFEEGLHFPVNPLYSWVDFDAREDSIDQTAAVPSQDQLQTNIDVSVRFRLNGDLAPQTLQETGTKDRVISVHLIPALRSILREAGKSIPRAEDFFLEETQSQLQSYLLENLRADLEPKGLIIDRVFIRAITLPPFITRAIEAKKEREQEVEKQRAELERFRTEQQQKIAQAEAERTAAEQQAEQVRLLADARAYEIEAINKAVAQNPAYVQLQALDALKKISEDPATKVYFINGDSPQPLPLMNVGEPLMGN